ncbi:NAD(P)/FAD-dependent oxidoreductase [Chitinophaga lutea]
MEQSYDHIIIGQGICGTLLSWELDRAGRSVLVYDEPRPDTPSRVAAGIINPVSGRRFETAWRYDELYPAAVATYRAMEAQLGGRFLHEREIWSVWPSEQMQKAFEAALPAQALMHRPVEMRYQNELQQPFGAGIVKGGNVQLNALLPAWRNALRAKGAIRKERFDQEQLVLADNGVRYGNVTARSVIFCEGAASPGNRWFSGLRFLPNKGEALIIDITGFSSPDIIKKGVTLVPMEDGSWWAGGTFSWDYADAKPTPAAREQLEDGLRQLLRIPYTVKDHVAAVRPSGMDRRPFAGLHPQFPQIGILNGMGSKGCSLAPAAAAQMRALLLENSPLWPEIDIKRYFKALR